MNKGRGITGEDGGGLRGKNWGDCNSINNFEKKIRSGRDRVEFSMSVDVARVSLTIWRVPLASSRQHDQLL